MRLRPVLVADRKTRPAVLLEIGQSADSVRDASVTRGKSPFLPGEPETDTAT